MLVRVLHIRRVLRGILGHPRSKISQMREGCQRLRECRPVYHRNPLRGDMTDLQEDILHRVGLVMLRVQIEPHNEEGVVVKCPDNN